MINMHQTPRIRVLSDRISRVLVFVYFCRGLSENMEGRPTRRVYIEILTCAILFLNLEDSRRTWPEAEPGGSPAQGAHPRVEGVRPALVANHAPPRGLCSTASKDQGKPNRAIKVGLIQWPTFNWGGYISKASPPLGRRRNHYQRKPSKLGFRILLSRRELDLATPNSFKFYRID